MNELQDQLNYIKAEEGFMAQMKAQQRLKDLYRAERQKEDEDISYILERTIKMDSAVRAINLERLLTRQWN